MQASFAIVVVFYIVMSLMASTVFGDNVLQPVTLNWREYNANGSFSAPPSINTTGGDSPQDGVGRPREWWVFAIQMVVLCFPIIDQVSVSKAHVCGHIAIASHHSYAYREPSVPVRLPDGVNVLTLAWPHRVVCGRRCTPSWAMRWQTI